LDFSNLTEKSAEREKTQASAIAPACVENIVFVDFTY